MNSATGTSRAGTRARGAISRVRRRAAASGCELHARFDALDKYFCATWAAPSGWMSWPEEYRDPRTARRSQEFAAANPQRIGVSILYLQWLAHEQLPEAQALARASGMPIGLYGDYAVGASHGRVRDLGRIAAFTGWAPRSVRRRIRLR